MMLFGYIIMNVQEYLELRQVPKALRSKIQRQNFRKWNSIVFDEEVCVRAINTYMYVLYIYIHILYVNIYIYMNVFMCKCQIRAKVLKRFQALMKDFSQKTARKLGEK